MNESESVALEKTAKKRELKSRMYRYSVYGLILLALVLFLWKLIGDRVVQNTHEDEMAELTIVSDSRLLARSMELVRTTGVASGLAMREALLAEDLKRLHAYADRLVQESTVEVATVAGVDGTVIASSDRKREGTGVESSLKTLLGALDTPLVDDVGDNRLRVVIPLTGLNRRIGYLLLIFRFENKAMS
jgi:uncharacterized membrane protein affecting hemolysin expression